MIYATCKLSATMHAYTWYIVLQPNKSKENLITVQNSVVSLFNNQRMYNYCSVKVIKQWCQKDREGGILLEGTWSYFVPLCLPSSKVCYCRMDSY